MRRLPAAARLKFLYLSTGSLTTCGLLDPNRTAVCW
jgi:hypothetical protein